MDDSVISAGRPCTSYHSWDDWLAELVAALLQTGVRKARSGHSRELTYTDR